LFGRNGREKKYARPKKPTLGHNVGLNKTQGGTKPRQRKLRFSGDEKEKRVD